MDADAEGACVSAADPSVCEPPHAAKAAVRTIANRVTGKGEADLIKVSS
jgi:hypothetical protein